MPAIKTTKAVDVGPADIVVRPLFSPLQAGELLGRQVGFGPRQRLAVIAAQVVDDAVVRDLRVSEFGEDDGVHADVAVEDVVRLQVVGCGGDRLNEVQHFRLAHEVLSQ